MRRTPTLFAPLLAAVLAVAGSARADLRQHAVTAVLALESPAELDAARVELPRFPAADGTLTGVALELRVRFRHRAGVENLAPVPAQVLRQCWSGVRATPLDGGADLIVDRSVSDVVYLAAHDGVRDFAGPSGDTAGEEHVATRRAMHPPLAAWIDAGEAPRRAFQLELAGWLSAGSGYEVASHLELEAEVELRVHFRYQPATP